MVSQNRINLPRTSLTDAQKIIKMSLETTIKAKSPLAYHRVLSPSASIKVSPICLGSMNFGETWYNSERSIYLFKLTHTHRKELMGECTKETAFTILDEFHSAGGNFIDTANMYMAGESEIWLGEWMKLRNVRDQIVLATKYSHSEPSGYTDSDGGILSNYSGSNKKALRVSLNASLKRLGTDYVDLYYVHAWEGTASIEELMRGLDDMVRSGKVLYLGVSNWPAWVVVKANAYAREHGLTPFVVYEGR
jgi:aryl-alcohol dehydrogenase-like predicted oxidoreductase